MRKKQIFTLIITIGIFMPLINGALLNIEQTDAKPQGIVLQCITRHDSVIYNLFENEFRALYPEVDNIQWLELATSKWASAIVSPSNSIDLLWGGGPTIFNQVADQDLVLPIQNESIETYLKSVVPLEFGGSSIMRLDENDDILWVAAAISSFGFTVNHDNLALYGLPVPETWEELASPEFFLGTTQHAVGMGDAPGTTSNTRVYQIILQKFGWEAGWDILTRMAGNSKIFPESGDTRDSVLLEQAVAMTIDFYGYQVQAQSASCEYILPKNESINNGDPIAIAAGSEGTEREYAEKFIEFVISPQAQGLWLHPDISRLPVLKDAFNYPYNNIPRPDLESSWENAEFSQGIEFDEDLAGNIYDALLWYFHATLTSATEQLYNAWSNIVTAYNNEDISEEEYRSLTRELSNPSITMEDALTITAEIQADPTIKDSYVQTWKDAAIARYQGIQAKIDAEKSINDPNEGGTFFDEFVVEISSPIDSEIVTGVTNIEAEIVDYGDWSFLYDVTNVEFFIDNIHLENVTSPVSTENGLSTFKAMWNTTAYSEGPHTIKVIGTERSGRVVQDQISAQVNIVKELPALTISSPINGDTVNETISITASASENADFGIDYVIVDISGSSGQVYLENITSVFNSISINWNTSTVENGVYTITVTAYYDTQNTKSVDVEITVKNEVEQTTTWQATPGFNSIGLLFGLLTIIGYAVSSKRKR